MEHQAAGYIASSARKQREMKANIELAASFLELSMIAAEGMVLPTVRACLPTSTNPSQINLEICLHIDSKSNQADSQN